MKILIITQYFWPENFRINDIALALKERGNEVAVLTGKPNYPKGKFSDGYTFFNKHSEYWNEIKIFRSPTIPRGKGKAIQLFVNYISFAIFASIRLLFVKSRFDKIFVYEPSPITVGIPGIVAKYKFRAPMYFWVQDLWPASISAAGGVKNKSLLAMANWLTKYIYKHSKKILVQSKEFIPYITNQDVQESKLVYYPNSTENYYKELDPDSDVKRTLPDGKKIMFAGNIGVAQSFDTLLSAALLLKNENENVQWLILGEGRMKDSVNQKIRELELQDTFHLLGSFPSSFMPKYFSCADALLVSLKKDAIFSLTVPSKIQSYLACGKPIITSLDGEGSRIIEEAKAGFASPSEDPHTLAGNIKKFLALSAAEQRELGKNARKYYDQEFERELLIKKLEDILKN